MEDKDKRIKELEEEVSVLRKELENTDTKSKKEKEISSFKWAETLTQEEIDMIVNYKITLALVDLYLTYDVSELTIVEEVLDFVNKGKEPEVFDDDVIHILSLGLRTTTNLSGAIYNFLKMIHDEIDLSDQMGLM